MRKVMVCTAVMVTLAACGTSDDTASGGEEATAVALAPGEYETKIEVTKFEMAGMPEAMVTQMRDQMVQNMPVQKTCITEENIEQMREQMVRQAANAPEGCTVDNRSSGNTVDATVSCTSPVKATSTVSGTLADMTIKSETEAGGQKVNMELHSQMTRVGDCQA